MNSTGCENEQRGTRFAGVIEKYVSKIVQMRNV